MKKKQTRQTVLHGLGLGLGLLGMTAAHADVQFNGFGQIVVGSTLGNKLIGSDPNNPETYATFPVQQSYEADPSFAPESLFALQVRAPLSDRFSATAQIVASGATDDDFIPRFGWAYATYQINDKWSVKGGRQRLPFYLYSDFLQVGAAYPWIRPPLSVYGAPLANFDGVSLNGSYQVRNWYLQPEMIFGEFDGSLSYHGVVADSHLHDITGLVLDSSYDEWLELRIAYIHSKNSSTTSQLNGGLVDTKQTEPITMVTLPVPGPGSGLIPAIQYVSSGLDQLAPVLAAEGSADRAATAVATAQNIDAAADQINLNDDDTTLAEGGFEIDRHNVVLTGEYIYSKTPGSFFVRASSYYVSLGCHFGMLMPILLYGHSDDRASNSNTPSMIPTSFFTPAEIMTTEQLPALGGIQTAAEMEAVNSGLLAVHQGAIEALAPEQARNNYYEFGLRYDLSSTTALKADYTFFRSGLGGVADSRLLSAAFVFSF